jgi:hypothetical protein
MQKKPQIDPQSDLEAAYKQVNANLNLLTDVLHQILDTKVEKVNCFNHHMDKLLSK